MFESKAGIFFIAGVGFFVLAFLGNGVVPMIMYKDRPELTAEELVAGVPDPEEPDAWKVPPNRRVLVQFQDLAERWPEQFRTAFGEPTAEKCAEALRLGRQHWRRACARAFPRRRRRDGQRNARGPACGTRQE